MAIPREPEEIFSNKISDGLRRDYTPAPQVTKPYLLGMLHDATERQTTYRMASKSEAFCEFLSKGIDKFGFKAWVYKEGKTRNLWIVEFSKNVLKNVRIKSKQDKIDYLQRDSYHIGLKIDGEYSRLLTQCYIKEYSNDAADQPAHQVIAWPEKLQFDMFALFLTRYRLHKQVYNHHTVKAFEYVIAKILQKLKEKDIPFIECSDSMVLCHLHADLRGVQDKLKQRKLPKLIAEKRIQPHEQEDEVPYPKYILDLIIDKVEMGFASSAHSNPLDQIYYFKDVHDPECFRLKASTTSFCIPEKHYETILRLYTTNPHRPTDPEVINNFLYKL